jgi:hypothetical protein
LASSLGTTAYFLGAGVGLSILTLFMQTSDEGASVSTLSLVILSMYALIGLLWLIIYVVNSVARNMQVSLNES